MVRYFLALFVDRQGHLLTGLVKVLARNRQAIASRSSV
jgi:hypothetical protein